jgi:hypothetical protein
MQLVNKVKSTLHAHNQQQQQKENGKMQSKKACVMLVTKYISTIPKCTEMLVNKNQKQHCNHQGRYFSRNTHTHIHTNIPQTHRKAKLKFAHCTDPKKQKKKNKFAKIKKEIKSEKNGKNTAIPWKVLW